MNDMRLAQEFIRLLPDDIQEPTDVGLDNDGDTRIDWDYGNRQIFSIAISEKRVLYYAGLVGTATLHGQAPFEAPIPEVILNGIRKTVSNQTFE